MIITGEQREAAYEAARLRSIVAPDLAALCEQMPGRYLRIPTGIAGLDQALRGGFRTANLNVLGGAPGGNKTTIAASIAYRWARDGVPTSLGRRPVLVSIIAADESRDGFLSRFGQIEHIERDALDDEDLTRSRPAWSAVGSKMKALGGRLRLWDPREDQITVEDAAEELANASHEADRRVLLVDQLQSKNGWACDDPKVDTPRAKVDARLGSLLRIARQKRLCVLVTSELSRAGYRDAKGADAPSKLSTFKESGGVEYDMDQGLVLARVDDAGRVDIHVVKTRWGQVDSVVRVKREGWLTFTEEGIPEPPSEEDSKKSIVADAAVLARCLLRAPGVTTTELSPLLRSELGTCSKDRASAAMFTLGDAAVRLVGPSGRSKCVYLDGSKIPPDVLAELPIDLRIQAIGARPPRDASN